ncbi:MAG: hypothetical protein ACFB2W_18045 [Leptolyngbyaceae cyanobacterium]
MLDRVFLDTNVYIVGVANQESVEWQILQWLGFDGSQRALVDVVISTELIEQILRVGKRLQNKDWARNIINQMWRNLKLRYVLVDAQEFAVLESLGWLPREDIGVYLTAKQGGAECFVSSNHELIRVMAIKNKDFECLKPEDFATRYF